ncbi:MAG: formate dehydrogenase accessory protein FdhE [Coriobacteriia bacterium]|nr:formate dehydrogenase accessory protein FdhE [Coriobacteriia bacterium]
MNIDLVSRAAEAYREEATGPAAVRLGFLQGLWEIQAAIEAVERPHAAADGDADNDALVGGQPLFAAYPPEVPVAEFIDAVSRIAEYVSDAAGLPDEHAEALRGADLTSSITDEQLRAAALNPEAFVAAVADGAGAGADGPLTPSTVAFVLLSALTPFLTGPAAAALKAAGDHDWRAWGQGRCPVCGSGAALGRMGESTAIQGADRVLWCGLCHAEWGYERIRCVRCGTRSQDRLRYSHIEDDPAHRLHLCDECHGYTRFVFLNDLRKPLSMPVEDAVSARLEAVALESGYTATGDGGAARC